MLCDFALAALCCAAPHICAVITLMLAEQAQLSAQSYSASANERACRIFQAHHCHRKIHLAAMDLFPFGVCSQPKEVHIVWKMCTLSLRMYRLLQWGEKGKPDSEHIILKVKSIDSPPPLCLCTWCSVTGELNGESLCV